MATFSVTKNPAVKGPISRHASWSLSIYFCVRVDTIPPDIFLGMHTGNFDAFSSPLVLPSLLQDKYTRR